jgi:hypothetical protein
LNAVLYFVKIGCQYNLIGADGTQAVSGNFSVVMGGVTINVEQSLSEKAALGERLSV